MEERREGEREADREEGRSRGGYQSHRDESAFVPLFIISLYHSLDHHNAAAMLEECLSAPPHPHTSFLPPSSSLSLSLHPLLFTELAREGDRGKEERANGEGTQDEHRGLQITEIERGG